VFSPVHVAPLSSPDPAGQSSSPHTGGVLLTTGLTTGGPAVNGPPVAPPAAAPAASASAPSSAIPVQHLLIPVSVGNGLQQLISIPLSLAAGAGNHIQLLATSSGQLIAANMAAAALQQQQQPAQAALHTGTTNSASLYSQSTGNHAHS